MYWIEATTSYKKDIKRAAKRGLNLSKLNEIINTLAAGKDLPPKHKDHQLTGNLSRFRECHIEPDWLLIYQKRGEELVLVLTRTGTHSDLF